MISDFRTSIVVTFTLLTVITVSIVTMNGYYQARASILDLSGKVIDGAVTHIKLRTVEVARRGENGLALLTLNLRDRDLLKDSASILESLWQLNFQSEFYYSVFAADSRGNFIQARKQPNLATRINYYAEDKGDEWIYRQKDYSPLAHVSKPTNQYNPLERPWYQDAPDERAAHWTDVYLWDPSREPGVTVFYPIIGHDGKKQGVAAIDVTLTSLNQFVVQEAIGEDSALLIINSKGEVIAYPESLVDRNIAELNSEGLPTVEQLGQDWISGAYTIALAAEDPGQTRQVEINGSNYFVKLTPIESGFSRDWQLLFVVPDYEILSTIDRSLYTSVMLAIIMLIIAIFSIQLIANRLTAPLQQVVSNAKLLEQLRFKELTPINSSYTEFRTLDNALTSLKYSLVTFSKYVPTLLIQRLMQSHQEVKLGGESRELAVIICEITGFSELSKSMNSHDKVIFLSRFQGEMTKSLRHSEATIDKFIGDKVIAFWGAPVATENDDYRACNGALDILQAMMNLNRELRNDDCPSLTFRTGLYSGEFVAGNFGSDERMFYSILGDGIQSCQQLSDLNKRYGTRIIVSGSTYEKTKDDFIYRWLDNVTLEEDGEAAPVYELLDGLDTPTTNQHQEYISAYEEALKQLYINNDKAGARQKLRSILQKYPDDPATSYLLAATATTRRRVK